MKTILLSTLLLLSANVFAQQKSSNSITDTTTGIRYVIDSSRTFVTAIGKDNEQIWRTSLSSDSNWVNEMNRYGSTDLKFIEIHFGVLEDFCGKEISFSSGRCFGCINKKNGKCNLMGCD